MKKSWVATEAIDHQGTKRLLEPLADLLGEIRRGGEYTDAVFSARGMSALIEAQTGLSVKFTIIDLPFIDASVRIPQLDKNHPLIANFLRIYATNDDMESVQKFVKGRFAGMYDRKDGKVYGDFTKITCPINLTTGLLKDESFHDHEIAAIILHELGHISSYFERLIDLVSANYAITTATEKILKLERNIDRVELLLEFDKYTGVTVPDKETIVSSDNRGTIYTHLICEVVKQRRNEEGDELYSYRAFEFSADQFAVRHGAGKYLVTSLDKIHRKQWLNPSYISWPLHVMLSIIRVLGFMALVKVQMSTNPFTLIATIGVLLTARPLNKIYDDPRERFDRIDREMVSELKNRQLTQERRDQILSDLYVVREASQYVKDKPGVVETIWAYVIPSGNDSRKRIEFQQSLERLANNNLFYAAAKLS